LRIVIGFKDFAFGLEINIVLRKEILSDKKEPFVRNVVIRRNVSFNVSDDSSLSCGIVNDVIVFIIADSLGD
jgi:hypothetical protein